MKHNEIDFLQGQSSQQNENWDIINQGDAKIGIFKKENKKIKTLIFSPWKMSNKESLAYATLQLLNKEWTKYESKMA